MSSVTGGRVVSQLFSNLLKYRVFVDMLTIAQHRLLVANLQQWLSAHQTSEKVEVIETHISSVLLAGGYAFKIKKPVDLEFLDFSTLEQRHFCCNEEIRLNSRLAADLYLAVVTINGSIDQPTIGGSGEVIEYAIKMRRFHTNVLLSEQPESLTPIFSDQLARQLALFHSSIGPGSPPEAYGTPEQVLRPMLQNFDQIHSLSSDFDQRLTPLHAGTMKAYQHLRQRLAERRDEGFIRECHGDLHLGNIALEGDHLILFDGIEFNPGLRWIDTMSELAFLLMDMEEKGLTSISRRLLNAYLEISGDYRGLDVLRFYQLYRAMVRAKVLAIRLQQPDVGIADRVSFKSELLAYLDNALRYSERGRPCLIITHGFSGSGKSVVSGELLMRLPLIRIRSDVERKRLAGLEVQASSGSPLMGGIYTRDFSEKTYDYLLALAGSTLQSGYAVIVDAAFLQARQRRIFCDLARNNDLPFLILDFRVPRQELRSRVKARLQVGSDPSEANLAVLERQFQMAEKITDEERRDLVVVDQAVADLDSLAVLIEHRVSHQKPDQVW